MIKNRRKLTSAKFLALGYVVVICVGAFLLALPISSKQFVWTPFIDALFTATSATCVTGLIVYDTFTHWSVFGQIVILILIQIGGIGFMTIITLFAMFLRRKIGLYERKVFMQSEGTNQVSGLMRLIRRVVRLTLLFELTGMALLSIRFVQDFGWGRGLYFSLFHSISAFCNAGFDLMGIVQPFSSLTRYVGDPLVSLTIAGLICVGGLGFIVWSDIIDCKANFKKFSLHTKVVLVATFSLILASTALFLILERNASMKGMNFFERLLSAVFQAITPRTAGYNTLDLTKLSNGGSMLTIILMFVGGCPGSTAGGVKLTTMVIVILGIVAAARDENGIVICKKRIEPVKILQAFAIVAMYLLCVLSAVLIMASVETANLKELLFEVVSAIGTVGLSLGITPTLTLTSQVVLILLMFMGRVGALSLLVAFTEKKENPPLKRPIGEVYIG